MKNKLFRIIALTLVFVLCLGTLVACFGDPDNTGNKPPVDEPDDLLGITDDTIWVGNTAATTGGMASIGAPFNLGIQAAFAEYNKAGGYNGKSIKLKHYDDGSSAENAAANLETLIHTDEVFAIVGHFGSYAVDVTLEDLIDNEIPMIYAAAGNDELLNENATSLGEKCIVPIQPLNKTEGRMLILRAFAPTDKGGLGGTKVGVISSNSNEASQSLLAGIKDEMKNLPEAQRNNVIIQDVAAGDYSSAVSYLKSQGCDTVILTVIGSDFLTTLTTMANSGFACNVLTSYNNASAATFNEQNVMKEEYESIFSTMNIFAQAWLDISSATYVYNDTTTALGKAYAALYQNMGLTFAGQAGFTEEYWKAAEAIYDYAVTVDSATAFAMSADAYALAGYIAGNLFCQIMEELEASGKALSRANFIEILESKKYHIAMADDLGFENGMRSGVQSFALTWIYDSHNLPEGATQIHAAASATVHSLMSIEDYRELLK